jgi:hypothetical protein
VPKNKERMSIDFPEGTKEKITQIKEMAKITTTAEVLRYAISIYEFILRQQESGWKIVLEKEGEEREVLRII